MLDSRIEASRRNFLRTGAAATLAAATSASAAETRQAKPLSEISAVAGGKKTLPHVVVHLEGHYLAGSDGSPFFWLGDTAWQLIQSTTREECSYYLNARARQGYTVIQTVVLAEFGGILESTATGFLPFQNADPRSPNEDFFNRVVEIVDEAATLGLYVALVPTWGDKLTAPWGAGPRIFRNDNIEDAHQYAVYLARKLKSRTNVLWVLGGDRPARIAGVNNEYLRKMAVDAGFAADQDWTPIWRAIAAGLLDGGERMPTIVYHPQGGRETSSFYFKDESWLSINGMQSGHGGGHDVPVWEMIAKDYALAPAMPTLDLEPNYEDHPYNPWPQWDPATGYFRDYEVRKQVYRSVFAGGCGVTYGHHAVWQFAGKRHEVINHADRDWVNALYRPAGRQVGFLRLLMESRPFFNRIPDQSLIVGDSGRGGLHMQATRDREGTYAFIYFPLNDQSATIDLDRLKSTRLRAWWFDTRTGVGTKIDAPIDRKPQSFQSPSYGPDWVLVVDDADAAYRPPGTI